MLMRHGVRFRGPALTRRTRDQLSTARIELIERNLVDDSDTPTVEYLVILGARDEQDAIARVRKLVPQDGSYDGFVPDP
jgi:hypothetical protein